MAAVPSSSDKSPAASPLAHGRQQQEHGEALVLLLLRELCADGACGPRVSYRTCHLRAIAQAFYVLHVVLCTAASSRGEPSPNPLLHLVHAGCVGVCTERDLYYRNPPLFAPQGQRAAHASIERLCGWLEAVAHHSSSHHTTGRAAGSISALFRKPYSLPVHMTQRDGATASAAPLYTRESLGITAAGKSLLCGAVVLELRDPPELLDVAARGPVGITLTYAVAARLAGCRAAGSAPAGHGARSPGSRPRLVLIEKESTYHALLQSMASSAASMAHNFVFLCTKGYPCIAARQWLRRVHTVWPGLPLYLMVDGDPHGLCIALTVMGLLGTQRCTPPDPAVRPPPAPGAQPMSSAGDVAPLPFRFLGVCPSLLWGRASTGAAARGRDVVTPAHGIPLTRDDERVLLRVAATARFAVAASTEHTSSPSRRDSLVTRRTLERLLGEVEWMQRARVKCELQLACGALGPLSYLEHHLRRCDEEYGDA